MKAISTSTAPTLARRRWLRRVFWLVLAGVVVFYGAALVMQHPRVSAALQRRLSASFGRAVEVGRFDLTLWGGPRLEAHGVTVAEDPRFGHEYFLRSERLTAGVRWSALLAGRLEFDSVVLIRPSLNLVRTAGGQWNLESWLPWPSTALSGATAGPSAPASSLRPQSVSIEGGRVNFKRGVDKHPFAVVGVEGRVSQAGSGQWSVDVEGRPLRAGVVVQEAGTIRVRGTLGGTSARFRPANLAVSWQEASLSDALRLLVGFDHGVRGALSVEGRISAPSPESLAASPAGSVWNAAGVVRLRGLHRWDLPPRDSDPALNLGFEGQWWPQLARAELSRITLEGPATVVRGSGFAQWGQAPAGYEGSEPTVSARPDTDFRFVSSGISLNDLFRWYPAFRGEVSSELSVEGNAGLDLRIGGWPPRVERVVMATDGARLRGAGLSDSPQLSSTVLRYERRRGRVELGPAAIRLGPVSASPGTSLRIEADAVPGVPWRFGASVAGQATNAGSLMRLAAALGIAPLHGWTDAGWQVEGSADVRLRWQGTIFPFAAQPQGVIRLRTAKLLSPALAEPLEAANAAIEISPGERSVTVQGTRALGTVWSGSLRRRGGEWWDVALSADALDAVEAHRWLAPQAQPAGFLQRLAPGRSAPPDLVGVLPGLRARGRVNVGQLRFHSLVLGQFQAGFELDLSAPWRLELADASASFFAGSIAGGFEARAPEPVSAGAAYRAEIRLRGVNLAALTAGTPRLRGFFSGTAGGELSLTATGATRQALLDSLAGEGALEVRNGQINALNLVSVQKGTTVFARAAGRFKLAERKLQFEELQLFGRPARLSAPDWLVVGAADLSGSVITLDMRLALPREARFRASAGQAAPAGKQVPARREFRLQGPLNALQFVVQP